MEISSWEPDGKTVFSLEGKQVDASLFILDKAKGFPTCTVQFRSEISLKGQVNQ